MLIKQSSTARALVFFMADSSDHVTGKTGLSPTVAISKNGGSFASPSGAVTEIANGFYKVAGNATDTNTLGMLALSATGSGADQATMAFEVVGYDPDSEKALAANWTSTRAGYIDNLSGGAVALASGVTLAASQSLYAPAKAGDAMTLTGAYDAAKTAASATALASLQTHGDATWATATGFAVPGSAMTLTSGERTAIANEVEAQIIDETDSEKVLTAITNKIASVNPSLSGLTLAAIASQVRTELATELGRIDAAVSSRMASYTQPTGFLTANFGLLDAAISTRAAATTALSTVVWTSQKAAYIDAAISGVSGGGGSGLSGPSSVTLTFEDGDGDPVPLVDFTIAGQGPERAGTDGVASFGLEDGEYTVVARPTSGVVFTNTSLTVSGTTTLTVTGSAVVIPEPDDAAQTTAYVTMRDGQGTAVAYAGLTFELVTPPGADSYKTAPFTAAADADGMLQVALRKGTVYRARRGDTSQSWVTFTTGSGSTYALPQILGQG